MFCIGLSVAIDTTLEQNCNILMYFLVLQVESPLSEVLGTHSASDFRIFAYNIMTYLEVGTQI